MRRREFLGVLGAAAWPVGARAQQGVRVRRIGFLMNLDTNDPVAKARIAAFHQGLQKLGWIEGRNLKIEYRVTPGGGEDLRKSAAELVALAPELIVATGTPSVVEQKRATRNIPIVFVLVSDPVAAGLVDGLARPGGNVTGFTNFEYSIGGKWLELLKEIAPNVTRAAVLRESFVAAGPGQFGAIQAASQPLGVELRPVDLRDAGNIERDINDFAQTANGGLIVTGSPAATVFRNLIYKLAAQYRLPTVFNSRFYVVNGGLISYGPDFIDQFRRAAGYVDLILRGQNPAELPVQTPMKYELVVNMKTARALGIAIPPAILTRADDIVD
jgi:ABC-type uncharacterized transport system substrate-binding protein